MLMLNASLSSTYAPMVAEAKRANVPLLFASSVCPKDVYPPADPLQFCTTAFAANLRQPGRARLRQGDGEGAGEASASRRWRSRSRAARSTSPRSCRKTLGMTPVDKEIIPPPTPDYTPFATKLKDADANWVFSWAPWVTQVRTFEALRRLDWKGDYITWAHLEAEGELARIKDGKFYVIGTNALFQDDLPIHAEIADAAKTANVQYPAQQMTEGWIAGMVIEAALKATGWPATPQKVAAAMNEPQGRHQGPARRPARVDQGQPLPHQAVLPRLALGSPRKETSIVRVQGLDRPFDVKLAP